MKRLLTLTICIAMACGLVGCGCGSKDNSKLTDDERVAITVDGNDVYLDEAKYYAYSIQGTYEVYFITSEHKDIDWNEKEDGATWYSKAKGQALYEICEREFYYDKRDEYNVKLDKEEKEEVAKKVKNYYAKTNKTLKDKIGIKKSRLKKVFEKVAIAQKVEDIMEANKKGSAGKAFKKWIDDVSVDCETNWALIRFDDHIFVVQNVDEDGGVTEENETEEVTEVTDQDITE